MAKFELRGYIILYFLFYLPVEGAVITVPPPPSVTVPMDTTATLTCEGIGDVLNWLVPSGNQYISFTDSGGPGNLSSVLTVTGSPVNNGISIGCQIVTKEPFDQELSYCSLTVTGVSPVEDLQYDFTSNNSLLITWSPPAYYSNDVPLGSPVSYQVLVTSDEDDGDIILNTNTTDTNIEVANVTECDTFNIFVTALVVQYISNDTTKRNNRSTGYSIAEYGTQPLIPSITFKFGCPPAKSFVSLMDGSTEVTDIINETEHIIEFKLSPFRHYELTAVVKNLRRKTRATYNTFMSTFHTQDIIISSPYTNGSVSVQCVFVSGSTDDECHVIFTDTDQESSRNVSMVQEPTLVILPAGNYTVTAYDIINGSLYGPAVYYPTLVEVILVEVIEVKPSTSTFSIIIINTNIDTGRSQTVPFHLSSLTTSAITPSTYSNDHTMSSQDSNTMPLLYIIIAIVGVMILTIIVIVIVTFVVLQLLRRKTNEVTEERITNNPAYAQVTPSSEFPHCVNSQISRVLTNNNPAYETVLFNANNINDLVVYETVH